MGPSTGKKRVASLKIGYRYYWYHVTTIVLSDEDPVLYRIEFYTDKECDCGPVIQILNLLLIKKHFRPS